MAVLVVDDLTCADDVLNLARHLLEVYANEDIDNLIAPGTVNLTRGPHEIPANVLHGIVNFDDDYTCNEPWHRDGCSCRIDAADTDPRQLVTEDPERHVGPVPYTICPQVGTHQQLTDCWMCWSDVHRGALDINDVLYAA